MLSPVSNSLRNGGIKGGGARPRMLDQNTEPISNRRRVASCFKVVLKSIDRRAGTPSNAPVFSLNLPRDLVADGEWALAVESFAASGTTFNTTTVDFSRRAWNIRLDGIQSNNALFSARGSGSSSDVIATLRGPTYQPGAPVWQTCGVRVGDKSMFYGKDLRLSFTYDTETAADVLVPELDASAVGNELLSWVLTLAVYRVDD